MSLRNGSHLPTTQCACADFGDFATQRNGGGGGREKDQYTMPIYSKSAPSECSHEMIGPIYREVFVSQIIKQLNYTSFFLEKNIICQIEVYPVAVDRAVQYIIY
jgi:hypothetical protein